MKKISNQVEMAQILDQPSNYFLGVSMTKKEVINQLIKNSAICCVIDEKGFRLTEYLHRLLNWAENYQERALSKVNQLIAELEYLDELWASGEFRTCDHNSPRHDGDFVNSLLAKFKNWRDDILNGE